MHTRVVGMSSNLIPAVTTQYQKEHLLEHLERYPVCTYQRFRKKEADIESPTSVTDVNKFGDLRVESA
jgi:hypothetical protein